LGKNEYLFALIFEYMAKKNKAKTMSKQIETEVITTNGLYYIKGMSQNADLHLSSRVKLTKKKINKSSL
jgi:hypothetical protein